MLYSYRGRKGLPVASAFFPFFPGGQGYNIKVLRLALSIIKSYAGKHDNRLFQNQFLLLNSQDLILPRFLLEKKKERKKKAKIEGVRRQLRQLDLGEYNTTNEAEQQFHLASDSIISPPHLSRLEGWHDWIIFCFLQLQPQPAPLIASPQEEKRGKKKGKDT